MWARGCLMIVAAMAAGARADVLRVPQDYAVIQQAINAARDGDEIELAPGLYTDFGNVDLLLTKRLTIRGPGGGTCIIDGEGRFATAIHALPAASGSVVRGIVYTRFASRANEGALDLDPGVAFTLDRCDFLANSGAGAVVLLRDGGSARITGCRFEGNASSGWGTVVGVGVTPLTVESSTFRSNTGVRAPIRVQRGSLTITDSTLATNVASNDRGGAVRGIDLDSFVLRRCVIERNRSSAEGGGVAVAALDVTIDACDFIGNSAAAGGGLYASAPTITLVGCTLDKNAASSYGGAWLSGDTVSIDRCVATGNVAGSWASAIHVAATVCSIKASRIENNEATSGGIATVRLEGQQATVDNCQFIGNIGSTSTTALRLMDVSTASVLDCRFEGRGSGSPMGLARNGPGTLRVERCHFSRNSVGLLADSSTDLRLADCEFLSNQGSEGAGLLFRGTALLAERCLFQRNTATVTGGAASIDPLAGTPVELRDCLFDRNNAGRGGAMIVRRGDVRLIDSTFIGNVAADTSTQNGGAIQYEGGGSTLTIRDCAIVGNRAGRYGGGIFAVAGTLNVARTTFTGNLAEFGGALALGPGSGTLNATIMNTRLMDNAASLGGAISIAKGAPTLANALLTGNLATELGGALHISGGAFPILRSITVADNTATGAGGIYAVDASARLENSIVWNNAGGEILGAFLLVRYSCVRFGYVGERVIDQDPRFLDPGGRDYRLGPGSPCVDAGDSNALPPDSLDLDGDGDLTEPIPLDLDGNPRRIDDPAVVDTGIGPPPVVDMGALERVPDSTCRADCDGSGRLDVRDFFCFQSRYAAGDTYADFDGNGLLDVRDFFAFQRAYAEGCR